MTIPALIPAPQRLSAGTGHCRFDGTLRIACDATTAPAVEMLSRWWAPVVGRERLLICGPFSDGAQVRFITDAARTDIGNEGYELRIAADQVTVLVSDRAGARHAVQTLRQLATLGDGTIVLPCLECSDHPRFPWRGMMLDSARHFLAIEDVTRLLDLMAMHKFNRFHWHLTDDQGWRLDLPNWPRLAEISAWRRETQANHFDENSSRFDGIPHGGFYTPDDVRLVVAHAARLGITVVPEIDLPGHVQALLAAYPELGNGGSCEVFTAWGVNPRILNVEGETMRVLDRLLGDVAALFPGQWLHCGGDEVPKDEWKASAKAQQRISALGLAGEEPLQGWYTARLAEMLAAHGRTLIGWDEILEGGAPHGSVVMSWRGEKGGIVAAQAGHDVVMAPTSYTYFDYYQGEDRTGEPLAIGGNLPLEKVYGYDPIPAALVGTPAEARVLGTQGQLWREFIPSRDYLDYMAFPRLCALGEAAWSAKHRDWNAFKARLTGHLPRLAAAGVKYRPLTQ